MRAILLHEYGDPSVLRLEDVPDPHCGPTEVVVEIQACGVNHCDLDSRAGTSRWDLELPIVLGGEPAGVVADVGSEVTGVRPGDPVAVLQHFATSDGRVVQFGIDRWGGYAEHIVVPETALAPLEEPAHIELAAAGQTVASTAWRMVTTLGEVQQGETVLIPSASGGVASALVGAATLRGARVIATVGGQEKVEAVRALGADVVADHTAEPVVDVVAEHTGGRGVDCVLDTVGGPSFADHLAALRTGGRLVTCGAHAGEVVPLDLVRLFQHGHRLIGFGFCTDEELRTAIGLVVSGRLPVPVAGRFPLADAADAHRALDARRHVGKILLAGAAA